jgi:hypothetical protein
LNMPNMLGQGTTLRATEAGLENPGRASTWFLPQVGPEN